MLAHQLTVNISALISLYDSKRRPVSVYLHSDVTALHTVSAV